MIFFRYTFPRFPQVPIQCPASQIGLTTAWILRRLLQHRQNQRSRIYGWAWSRAWASQHHVRINKSNCIFISNITYTHQSETFSITLSLVPLVLNKIIVTQHLSRSLKKIDQQHLSCGKGNFPLAATPTGRDLQYFPQLAS